jgi:integrase
MSEPLRLIFRLALLTGQRRSERHNDKPRVLLGDPTENSQIIHGRTKNRRDQIAPLIEVVAKAVNLSRESEFVFPSPMRDARVGHINGEAVSMAMRCNRTEAFGVPDMRTHDLSRTLWNPNKAEDNQE